MLIDIPIDFSALSTLHCARKYQLSCVQGLDTSSKETRWGSAFHKFMEERNRGNITPTLQLVMEYGQHYQVAPVDTSVLLSACTYYENTQRAVAPITDSAGAPLVEWKFSFPYMTTDRYRILLSGTVDIVYKSEDNILVFRDYKTTAKASGLEKHELHYLMSFQIPFYLYCLQYHLAECLAPEFADLANAGRLIGEYQFIYKSFTPAKVKVSSPVRAWNREDIEAVLHPLIAKAIGVNDLTTLAAREGSVLANCEGCAFSAACLTSDPDRQTNMLANFPRRVYDPMSFR